jgi:hypothetical protein
MKLLFVTVIFSFFSCNKEYSCENCLPNRIANATVINSGPVASDGCGWLIKIDSTLYHPEVLDAAFQQENLPVKITDELSTDTFQCGFRNLLPIIRLKTIEI